jgi:hypothetical protein
VCFVAIPHCKCGHMCNSAFITFFLTSHVPRHKLLENLVLGLAPDAFKPPTEPHEFLIRAMWVPILQA